MAEAKEITSELAFLKTNIANVYFVGTRNGWVLMDSGVSGYAEKIRDAASARFGTGSKPSAIVLTHGHFDHAGNALELAKYWGVPVYAHTLEFPYLTGRASYPEKDPTVGGAMAFMSRFFPTRTANLSEVLLELPVNGEVPGMSGWMWMTTPGHAPGHVSFWCESDRTLVAGDALATADLDSWTGLIGQKQVVSRPPAPFTFDWGAARSSVQTLADLKPNVLACGHGVPMSGSGVAQELTQFSRTFTPPSHGRYVPVPAVADSRGVVFEPPKPADPLPKLAAGVAVGALVTAGVAYSRRSRA